jgi:hypothetical protein
LKLEGNLSLSFIVFHSITCLGCDYDTCLWLAFFPVSLQLVFRSMKCSLFRSYNVLDGLRYDLFEVRRFYPKIVPMVQELSQCSLCRPSCLISKMLKSLSSKF